MSKRDKAEKLNDLACAIGAADFVNLCQLDELACHLIVTPAQKKLIVDALTFTSKAINILFDKEET